MPTIPPSASSVGSAPGKCCLLFSRFVAGQLGGFSFRRCTVVGGVQAAWWPASSGGARRRWACDGVGPLLAGTKRGGPVGGSPKAPGVAGLCGGGLSLAAARDQA